MNATDKGLTLWFTGLSGSGKSTLATYLLPKLRQLGKKVEIRFVPAKRASKRA